MSPFPEESKWPKNPLPPAPNSILMCGQTPSSVEAASRKGCCGGKVGSLSLICDGSNPLVPALRLYGTQLPRLDEADMSVPAKPSAHTSNSSSPPQQEQRALKCFPPLSVRSLGSTPCKSDKMAHSGMVGEVTATSVEVPIGMARRTSVRFLPSQGANGAGTGQTGDAVPGCCRTDGGSARPSAGGAEMMSPRCGTPHRLPGDAYSRRGDRTSAVSTQSCSQRPDSPHQHPGMQDTNIRHSGNDLEGICFLPLGFSSSLHSARVQSHNSVSGILPTGTDGASTSAPSLLSPASILHKSSMTTLSRPSYTTSGNASHQLWRSSQFFGARSGAKDSRCEPECLHSSSSPRFVEDDLSQMQLLSRHDSDSSEDARIVEGAKSVIECFRKRNSAPSTSCGL
ncbi:hypothetical protein ABL78_6014 [Leptomonas seymouri]|uniref:Uncharacterized protein n=1 Tax=Leptomonas seymouri TaxID=5684 RepID=A0A0N1PC75_LEPSE|nr:hypothetical protein ABL78_6014 [Leptomonas seymouri]|eukprot:KPI84922.1 hypothetical protein ABL78_6014 [Leptomonas seymouri]